MTSWFVLGKDWAVREKNRIKAVLNLLTEAAETATLFGAGNKKKKCLGFGWKI